MVRGLEFESLTCKIIYLIAKGGNQLVTTTASLADYLESTSDLIQKELIHMSRQGLIGMRRVNMTYKIKDIEFSGNFIKLTIKPKADSLIMIGDSNLFYMNKVKNV
nr:MAG TPA: hypothetical protein [Caudoviricetes sp.]